MQNKKAIAPIFLIVIILSIILLFLIIAGIGKFTIFGKTFRIVPEKFSIEIVFWSLLALWIIIQVGVVYGYVQLGKLAIKYINFLKNKYETIIKYVKGILQ